VLPAGTTLWVAAKDVRELLGCSRSQAYEHLHRAGATPAANGRALRIRADLWESYAARLFGGVTQEGTECLAKRASDPAAVSESFTLGSTSTASASSAPPGPLTWRRRNGSLLVGSAKPKIRAIIPKQRRPSSER
jgi:hypothetical protein